MLTDDSRSFNHVRCTGQLEGKPDAALAEFLSEQRLIKDALELRELKTVIDATMRRQLAVASA
jgi:hypothetical protein